MEGVNIEALLSKVIHYYIYVWVEDGPSFWMFPTNLSDEGLLAGYIWTREQWSEHAVLSSSICCFA